MNLIEKAKPLEEVDPELGQLLMDVANGRLLAHVHDARVFKMSRKARDKYDLRSWSRRVVTEIEPGRNDPCPCGSGRKYKKCCMKG